MSSSFVRPITIVCLAIVLLLSAASSLAAEDQAEILVVNAFGAAAVSATAAPPVGAVAAPRKRPAALVPLYAGFVALQAVDMHSTMRAISGGGREANPLVSPIVGSSVGLMAVKAGSAAAVMVISEKLWKRNRTAAVITMIAMNSAYAMVAAHNYAIAR